MPSHPTETGLGNEPQGRRTKIRRLFFGRPKNLSEPSLFHRLSLIPILAWIGLGADGLSSACYGPEEAFRAVFPHTYMAFALAAATAITVFLIAGGYSRVIEEFPNGGGGYLVASKLLGPRWGVVSGSALLIDYVLTIAVSIVAAGDALFSLAPLQYHFLKVPIALVAVAVLTILNIRGVKESVLALAPIFMLFVATHAILIFYGIFSHGSELAGIFKMSADSAAADKQTLGMVLMAGIFIHAFSLGGGTYTGIEAVSNGMQIMREPRVHTGRKTMLYMAVSLALTASGLLICYLLWDISPVEGKTMNATLSEKIALGFPGGDIFVLLTMIAAGAVLIVAAQAGFLDGPRVLANMASDRWAPTQFAHLSERLTTINGILLMGSAAILVIIGTRGNIHHLIVMYSINVFLTFSLTMIGMLRFWAKHHWREGAASRILLFSLGGILCITILAITVKEKFLEGGWITLASTGLVIGIFVLIHRHYSRTSRTLNQLDDIKKSFPVNDEPQIVKHIDPTKRTAVILVGGYSGLGLHTLLSVRKSFPDQFANAIFLSVGIVESGEIRSAEHLRLLQWQTDHDLELYVEAARQIGFAAEGRSKLGTDVIEEAVALCRKTSEEFPNSTFFAGQLVFKREAWYHRYLHNQTAFLVQRHLIWEGKTMVVLPIRVLQPSKS